MSLIAAALLFASSAHALTAQWWGLGPSLGTVALPISYPQTLPALARPTINGEEVGEVDPLRGDVQLGLHAVAYPSPWGRADARLDLGLGGSGYTRFQGTLGYDAKIAKVSGFQVLLGGALGVGRETLHDRDEVNGRVGDDSLQVTYMPLRLDLAVLKRDQKRAYELGIYTQLHIAGKQEYCLSSGVCSDATLSTGASSSPGLSQLYWDVLGLNATVYFGDFKNEPKKRSGKKNGSRGGSGGGKGGKGKGGGGGSTGGGR